MTKDIALESLKRRAGLGAKDSVRAPPTLPVVAAEAQIVLEELRLSGKHAEISGLTVGIDPDPAWAEIALESSVCVGDYQSALAYFEFCMSQAGVRTNLPVKALVSVFRGLLVEFGEQLPAPRARLTDEKQDFLENVLPDADRRIGTLDISGGVTVDLDHEFCTLYLQILSWLGEKDRSEIPTRLLVAAKQPFPVTIAIIMQLEYLPTSEAVVEKLRLDYPQDLKANMVATILEGQVLNQYAQAFGKLFKRRNLASTNDERREVHDLLLGLADHANDDQLRKTVHELRMYWSETDERLESIDEAMSCIDSRNLDKARSIIDTSFDDQDPLWLRVKANLDMATGDSQEAAETLFAAAEMGDHWRGYMQASEVASIASDWALAAKALDIAIQLNPDNVAIKKNLIAAYNQLDRLDDVERLLRDLLVQDKFEFSHRLNLARILVEQGLYEESLEVLSADIDQVNADLGAALLRTELLRMTATPDDAFAYINSIESMYENTKDYWFARLELSYATGHDREGHECLQRLLALKERGLVSDKELWAQSIDDIKDYVESRRSQHKNIIQHIATGKIPWLYTAQMTNGSAWLSWLACTQPLIHLWDTPEQKIAYSIYASNGFTTRIEEDNTGILDEITAPASGTSVVVDVTALLTITQLQLLPKLEEYFDEIIVPSVYSVLVINEARHLRPHQKSQYDSSTILLDALTQDQIKTAPDPLNDDFFVCDPYNGLRLADSFGYTPLLQALKNWGRLSQKLFDGTEALRANDREDIGKSSELAPNAKLVIEETALRMLVQNNIWESLTENFNLFLTDSEAQSLRHQAETYNALESTRKKNDKLAKWIGSAALSRRTRSDPVDELLQGDWTNQSYLLAQSSGLPLLADDRAWHAVLANERGEGFGGVFDTSAFLNAAKEKGIISSDEFVDAYMQLIEWRYKFIVVPSEVMVTTALRYRDGLPGDELRSIAKYVHDSASDPAMFGGLEQVSPPTSMSARWYLSYLSEIAHFLVDVWASEVFTDEQASTLTIWSARCLMPSLIASMQDIQRVRLTTELPRAALSHFALAGANKESIPRIHNGFLRFAEGLGLTPDERDVIAENLVRSTADSV